MNQTRKSRSVEAIVIKRTSVGEADRVVTLLTKEQGKLTCIAKGARKISSSKRAYLEPGNYIKCLLISTKSMSLLTQATLIKDCAPIHGNLPKIRQLSQLLEIIDSLFVEEEIEERLFEDVTEIRDLIVQSQPTTGRVKLLLENLITDLGYQHPQETKYASLLEYVSALADKPLRSWEYLKV